MKYWNGSCWKDHHGITPAQEGHLVNAADFDVSDVQQTSWAEPFDASGEAKCDGQYVDFQGLTRNCTREEGCGCIGCPTVNPGG